MPADVPRPLFGKLLTEAISSVSRRKRVNMEIVEGDLAYEISQQEGRESPLSFYTVQRWMRGFPPECQRVQATVRFCAKNGRIPRDLAEGILKQANCDHLLPMLEELYGALNEFALPRIYTNLPRNNPRFRGREDETTELLKRLSPENRSAVIVVYGLGGIGKTTLVTEVCHLCLSAEKSGFDVPYEAVVFTSARDQTLTLIDVYDEIGRVLEYQAVLRKPADEKSPLIRDLLRKFKVLLVIDNFETVDDKLLTRFALEEVPPPSKVVITTRDYHPSLWPGTWPIHLTGLDDIQALQLIHDWTQDYNLKSIETASDSDLEPLLRATEGSPYALLTALGLIANQKQPLVTVLRDLWEGRGQIFDYIFSRVWDLLSEDEKSILLAMPCFVSPITRKGIGSTAGVEGYSLSKSLGRLAELSLVIPDEQPDEEFRRYRVHPLTRSFASGKARETDKESLLYENWLQWCRNYAIRYGGESFELESYLAMKAELENLLAASKFAFANEKIDAGLQLAHAVSHAMYIQGDWDRVVNLNNEAYQLAKTTNRKFDEIIFRVQIGNFHYLRDLNLEAALKMLQDIYQEIESMNSRKLLYQSDVLSILGQILITRQEDVLNEDQFNRSEFYLTQQLNLCHEFGDRHGELRAQYYLIRASILKNQFDVAKQDIETFLFEAKEIGWQRALGYGHLRMAEISAKLGRPEDAKAHFGQALDMARQWGEILLEQTIFRNWSALCLQQREFDQALEYARRACDLAIRLGAAWDQVRAENLIEHILAQKN